MSFSIDDKASFRSNGALSVHDDSPQQQQPPSLPRSPYYAASVETYRRPRSPFVPDPPMPAKARYGTTPGVVDVVGRVPRASPLSIPTSASRTSLAGGRNLPADRSTSAGISRSPYTPLSKFFVTVVPPVDLASEVSGPSSRNTSFANASSHLRRGTLMPLYPTLGAQLYAISREYGLPSIGGLTVFLCDDGEGNLGPRVGEETWPYLWARYFDDNAEELYHDITNPTPLSSTTTAISSFSNGHDRRFSEFSTDDAQASMDKGSTPNGGARRGTLDEQSGESFDMLDPREYSASGARRMHLPQAYSSSSQAGISPRQLATPSPLRTLRHDMRASPAPSAIGASRLPIVARIEWAVDKARAPWWNQWIGATAPSTVPAAVNLQAQSRSTAIPVQPQPQQERAASHARRRSMHLPRLHNGSSSAQTAQPQSPDSERGVPTQPSIRSSGSIVDVLSEDAGTANGGYSRLDDDDEEDREADRETPLTPPMEEEDTAPVELTARMAPPAEREEDNFLSVDTAQEDGNSHSYDTQSYAGFSALMGVVNSGGGQRSAGDERSARGTITSMHDGDSEASGSIGAGERSAIKREEGSLDGGHEAEDAIPFDLNALPTSDDGMWQDLQGAPQTAMAAHTRAGTFDALSASSLNMHKGLVRRDSPERERGSAVHEWITKTHSPSEAGRSVRLADEGGNEARREFDGALDDNESELNDKDDLLPPQDDVAEVVGLWAEKTVQPSGTRVLDGMAAEPGPELQTIDGPDVNVDVAQSVKRASSQVSASAKHASAGPSSASHSRQASSVAAESSRRSSRRCSRRSSRRTRPASQDQKLLSAPATQVESEARAAEDLNLLSAPMTHVEDEARAADDGQGSQGLSKASLLSPIALQESAGVFGGLAPNLAGLLPPSTPEAHRKEEADISSRAAPSDETEAFINPTHITIDANYHPVRQDSASLETPTITSPTMLSPRLQPPSVRSPGQMSGSSSSSDISDALIDMERALALLSPAGFQKSPAVAAKVAPVEVVAPSRTKRTRIGSHISASESMARARSLSASVSPSPRWFRAGSEGMFPALPNVTSPSEASMKAGEEDMTGQTSESTTASALSKGNVNLMSSPRPVSLSAATFEATRKVTPSDMAALAAMSGSLASRMPAEPLPQLQAPATAPAITSTFAREAGIPVPIKDEDYQREQLSTLATPADLPDPSDTATERQGEQTSYTEAELDRLEESYDDNLKDNAMVSQWLAAQQKQLPCSPSTDASIRSDDEERDVGPFELNSEDYVRDADGLMPPPPVPRKETTYATIGVQAEIESSDRSSAQFSLVSGDATSESGEYGSGADAVNGVLSADLHVDSDDGRSSTSIGDTPRGDARPTFDATQAQSLQQHADVPRYSEILHSSSTNDMDEAAATGALEQHARTVSSPRNQHMAFESLIRGSFADSVSDMFSSKAVSPRMESEEIGEEPNWMQQSQHDRSDGEHDGSILPSSPPHDDSTTTRGGASTNRDSSMSDDQWSQDGSAYGEGEGDAAAGALADDEDSYSQASFQLDRRSHQSGFSNHLDLIEQSGGHTPTFLYDRHLAADDDGDANSRGLSPMSADRRGSGIPTPQRGLSDSSATQRESGGQVVDALGIGLPAPTARVPMPSFDHLVERHRIVSLAGEPVDEADDADHMPTGFEQVPVVQSPIRATAQAEEESAAYIEGKPLRRSMGSISDRQQKEGGLDARRSSASAAAMARGSSHGMVMPGPRRSASPHPMISRDGTAKPPNRRSMSPLSSPRHRFGALPPSPSLQANVALFRNGVGPQQQHLAHGGSPPDMAQPTAMRLSPSSYGVPQYAVGVPRRVGSPLIIDTGKAQSMPMDVEGEAAVQPPQPFFAVGNVPQRVGSPHSTQMFRSGSASNTAAPSAGANSSTPPSPRGPRAQPFTTPPLSVMPAGVS